MVYDERLTKTTRNLGTLFERSGHEQFLDFDICPTMYDQRLCRCGVCTY